MRKLVSYTDYLAICTARNERQARAIVDEVKLRLKNEDGLLPGGTDGEGAAGWIVLDFLDAVLHVFTEEAQAAIPARGPLARGAAARSRRSRRMTSEGTSTVPRMGSFQRAFLGYRRPEVDAAIRARDGARSRPKAHGSAELERRGRATEGRGRGRADLALGHGDRARARDPRPQRAACSRPTSATTAASPRSTRSPPGSRRSRRRPAARRRGSG